MNQPATTARGLIAVTVGAAVCYVGAVATIPVPPTATDSGAEVVRYFTDHANTLRWSVWFGTLALVFLMVAVALITERLPRPARTVFLVGAIVVVATTMVQAWFSAGLASHARSLEPGTARTLFDIYNYYGPILTAATMVMLGAIAVVAFSHHMPTWYGVLTAIVFVEQLIETITIFGRDGFLEPGGAMNLKLGAGLFIVWFVASGFVFALRPPGATEIERASDLGGG